MGVGEIAGLIAAIAFAVLAGFMLYPLLRLNKISAAASTTANNVGALTDLYGSFLGKPIIKIASTFYALKTTGQSFLAKNAAKTTVNDTAEKGE